MATSTDPEHRPTLWLQDNYEIIQVLGRGAQSEVVLCRSHQNGELVAVKSAVNNETQGAKMTAREARFLKVLRMRNIIKLEDWYVTPENFVLIIEACDWDLYQWMDMYSQVEMRLPHLFVWRLFSRIADALAFIHHHGVVHHDIKPPNILLKWDKRDARKEYPEPVLADFGAATHEAEPTYDPMAAPAYTMLYHPPDPYRGPSMDVWGLGSIIHEIALGRTVVKTMPDDVRVDTVKKLIWVNSPENKRIGRGIDKVYSPELETCMFYCLRFTKENRIESRQLSKDVGDAWRMMRRTLPFVPLEEWTWNTVETRAEAAAQRKLEAAKVAVATGARRTLRPS